MPNASPNASKGAAAALRPPALSDRLRAALGPLLTVSPALLFAWWHPAQNAWAALALGLALAVDTAARQASRLAHARTGIDAEFRGVASPLLMLGDAVWLGGLLVALGAWARPDLFPLLAAALAGLVAMGACARLALTRAVIALDAEERAATGEKGNEKSGGRGR